MVTSPVPVTRATLKMDSTVRVSSSFPPGIVNVTHFTTADIDECDENSCDTNADCINTTGSFTCTCNQGYSGNGLTCIGMQMHILLP